MFLVIIVYSQAATRAKRASFQEKPGAGLTSHGYPFYTPEDSGILVGNNYPPLSYLAFLPATLISHPVPAIITGSLFALLMNLSPGVGARLVQTADAA